jgi:hypothetical protein
MGAKRAPFFEIFALSRLTCFTGMHDSISRRRTECLGADESRAT